jgi:hypothetical protein
MFVHKAQWAAFLPSNLFFAVSYQVTKLLVPQEITFQISESQFEIREGIWG